MSNQKMKDQFSEIVKKVDQLESQLNSVRRLVNNFDKEYLQIDYSQVEGVVGTFDGIAMVTKEGKRYEVPANYAAKSKLVYGDVLKLIEEEGKKLFKQIERVNRKKIEGILTKKEGEWYMLTDRGSYRVSDVAAEFQNAVLNAEVTAYLPEDNLNVPFATIDMVVTDEKKKPEKPEKSGNEIKKEVKKDTKKDEKEESKEKKTKPDQNKKRKNIKKPADRGSKKKLEDLEDKENDKKSDSGSKKILADDDLV